QGSEWGTATLLHGAPTRVGSPETTAPRVSPQLAVGNRSEGRRRRPRRATTRRARLLGSTSALEQPTPPSWAAEEGALGSRGGSGSTGTIGFSSSQASPMPSPSSSAWSAFDTVGQLSRSPQMPSPSRSFLGSKLQGSQASPSPSKSASF